MSEGFEQCPKGHTLPHATEQGRCTPMYCAVPEGERPKKKGKKEDLLSKTREEVKAITAKRQYLARRDELKVPDVQGALAEQYADKKLVDLLPDAVASLEWDIKYGDPTEKRQARKEIMEANGRGKREQGGGAVSPIVILTGGAVVNPPWREVKAVLDSVKDNSKVVEGEIVPSPKVD